MEKLQLQKPHKRSLNFNTDEIDRLMNLVIKYRHIILNKKSDNYSVREKDEAWKLITEEYNNGLSTRFRDTETLRCKYKNIKSGKSETYERYRKRIESGSVIPLPMKETDHDTLFAVKEEKESIKDFSTDGEENDNESAVTDREDPLEVPETLSDDEPFKKHIKSTLQLESLSQATTLTSKPIIFQQPEAQSTPVGLSFQPTRPIPQPTRFRIQKANEKRQAPPTDKWQELAEEKILVAREKRIQQNEQHKLLLKNIQEEHSLKMKIMQEEFELNKKKLELELLTLKQKIQG